MAVKKNLKNSTIEDVYDTQNALDTGILGSVAVPTKTTTPQKTTGIFGEAEGYQNNVTNTVDFYNKDTLGSILGMTDPINQDRRRRKAQEVLGKQGFGVQSSILGGSQF